MLGRHLYRIHFNDGTTKEVYGKESLIGTIKPLNHEMIDKILWYKSNGFWVDKTATYLKR